MYESRYGKRKETINRIRRILLEHEKVTWQHLLNEIKRSPATLSDILRQLIRNGEIITETDPEDRRITYYILSDKKKAQTEIKRYETTTFILSLKDPVYDEKHVQLESGIYVTVGVFSELGEEDKVKVPTISVGMLPIDWLEPLYESARKFALVLTFERNKK